MTITIFLSSSAVRPLRRWAGKTLRKLGLRQPPPPRATSPDWNTVTAGPLVGGSLFLEPWLALRQEMLEGRYDSFLYDALARLNLALDGAIVWDVGAYIGYHTLAFAALVGDSGRVVAFEPNPANVERIRVNVARNTAQASRIQIETLALADTDGPQAFSFEPGKISAIGFLEREGIPSDRIAPVRYAQCQVMRITAARADTLIGQQGFTAPAVVKIDVEGAEVSVLRGAQTLIAQHKPVLFIEIHNITALFYTQQMLYAQGYTLTLLDPEHASSSRCFILAHP